MKCWLNEAREDVRNHCSYTVVEMAVDGGLCSALFFSLFQLLFLAFLKYSITSLSNAEPCLDREDPLGTCVRF
jgi:hypothetical protein